MSTPLQAEPTRVLVPLDLSSNGHDAFEHALKIALVTRGVMVPLDVHAADRAPTWQAMPMAREVLVRWGASTTKWKRTTTTWS